MHLQYYFLTCDNKTLVVFTLEEPTNSPHAGTCDFASHNWFLLAVITRKVSFETGDSEWTGTQVYFLKFSQRSLKTVTSPMGCSINVQFSQYVFLCDAWTEMNIQENFSMVWLSVFLWIYLTFWDSKCIYNSTFTGLIPRHAFLFYNRHSVLQVFVQEVRHQEYPERIFKVRIHFLSEKKIETLSHVHWF